MFFHLLELHRNYRNIDNISFEVENYDSIVLGHFDFIKTHKTSSAELALDEFYNKFISEEKLYNDIQPMLLFSYEDYDMSQQNGYMAITFMQIDKPEECDSIKDFYDYSSQLINQVVTQCKARHLIDNVDVRFFIPFSFMSTAIIICADNLTDICTLIKNITFNKIANYQYSILSIPANSKSMSCRKNINISLRFIWRSGVDTNNAISLLKKSLKGISVDDYTINHLLGNNDCLLYVPLRGYEIINLFYNSNDFFDKFKTMVENTRATISFPDGDVVLKDFIPLYKTRSTHIELNDDSILIAEKKLISSLNKIKANASPLQQNDINDVLYRINHFANFIEVIRKHACKGIATPLYFSMKDPYKLFLEMAEEKLDFSNPEDVTTLLNIIGSVLNDMSSYFENIFHCNLGFIEERGFYNNIIGLASDIELAYNRYANHLFGVIMSEKESKESYVCCSVTSDKEPIICTNDIFDIIITEPRKELRSLVNVNIPVSYVFKYYYVIRMLVHEIAHHVGERHRKIRLQVISKGFASVISDVLIQTFVLSYIPSISEIEKEIIKDFEKSNEYTEIHNDMCKNIFDCLYNYIINISDLYCKKTDYFLDNVIDAIISTLNAIPNDEALIKELSTIVTTFQFWFYEFFEDFYLTHHKREEAETTVIREISNFSIKDLNYHLVRYTVINLFDDILSSDEGSSLDETEEKYCHRYIPELNEFISYFCQSVSEAYCDIVMITLCDMNFDEYLDLMSKYGKNVDNILYNNDYFTWLRINYIARYLGVEEIFEYDSLSERFKYFEDIDLFGLVKPYFEGLKPEFTAMKKRCESNKLLFDFLNTDWNSSEEQHLISLYSMFFDITNNKGASKNE